MHWLALELKRMIQAIELFAVFQEDVHGESETKSVRSLIERALSGFVDYARIRRLRARQSRRSILRSPRYGYEAFCAAHRTRSSY